jgi:hypothetical protein
MHPLHNKACCILFPQASDSDRERERESLCVYGLEIDGFKFNFINSILN